jgi:hypothetical protein
MSVGEIENAVQNLPASEFAKFRKWFAEFEAQQWDRQFEDDVKAGRLDGLAAEALDDLANGRCRDL